jgi:hypothetical protein
MIYFYRFLRTKDKVYHKSELKNPIRFYIEDDCKENQDFRYNQPIADMKAKNKQAQISFGMTSVKDVFYAYKLFGEPDNILSRISLEFLIEKFNLDLHDDQQVNSGFSKYLLAEFRGERIVIPDENVEVLSLQGWIPKDVNTYEMFIKDFYGISPFKYAHILTNLKN